MPISTYKCGAQRFIHARTVRGAWRPPIPMRFDLDAALALEDVRYFEETVELVCDTVPYSAPMVGWYQPGNEPGLLRVHQSSGSGLRLEVTYFAFNIERLMNLRQELANAVNYLEAERVRAQLQCLTVSYSELAQQMGPEAQSVWSTWMTNTITGTSTTENLTTFPWTGLGVNNQASPGRLWSSYWSRQCSSMRQSVSFGAWPANWLGRDADGRTLEVPYEVINEAATTGDAAWERWVQAVEASADERAARQRAREVYTEQENERRRAAEQKEADRAAARARARELLFAHLTAEQRSEYTEHRRFRMTAKSGRLYEIREGSSGNVIVLDPEMLPIESLCAAPARAYELPLEDVVLAQKIALEADEEGFRRIANITPQRRYSRAVA